MNKWISVNDALPTEAIACWVWSEDWGDGSYAEFDDWTGRRGEVHQWADGEKYIHSGWYNNCGARITHWMPIEYPEPPRKKEE